MNKPIDPKLAKFIADSKAESGITRIDKGGRPPQQINLDMAREAAERQGQHHDPLTRSLQQGYEHGWYHGSTGDIKAFDPSFRGESTGAASAKKGYFFARDPSTPPPEMLEHDPESLALLQRIGATIPPKPTMAGHGAHTASSYAGTGGSREYKEAMRMAKEAERAGNWDAYDKYMQLAEDVEINNMRYRQDLVAKHGDARDLMYEHIKNAWYGPHNAEIFKGMSQPDYETHDKRYKELMPYGWHINYEKPHFEALKAELQKFGNNNQVKSALDAINHYQSVHGERKASELESGANVMPVALRYKNPMYHDFKGKSYRDQTYSDLMDQAISGGHDALILKNTYDPGGIGKPKMVDVGVMFHPNQIRSKFAAFDPTRTKESNLLANRGGLIHKANGGKIDMFNYSNFFKGPYSRFLSPKLRLQNQGNYTPQGTSPLAPVEVETPMPGPRLPADYVTPLPNKPEYPTGVGYPKEPTPYPNKPEYATGVGYPMEPRIPDESMFQPPVYESGVGYPIKPERPIDDDNSSALDSLNQPTNNQPFDYRLLTGTSTSPTVFNDFTEQRPTDGPKPFDIYAPSDGPGFGPRPIPFEPDPPSPDTTNSDEYSYQRPIVDPDRYVRPPPPEFTDGFHGRMPIADPDRYVRPPPPAVVGNPRFDKYKPYDETQERFGSSDPANPANVGNPRFPESSDEQRPIVDPDRYVPPPPPMADGGQVPSGPSPEMLAKLMQLRDQLRPLAEANERRQQGIANMEKANGPLRLPTDQKAQGGNVNAFDYENPEHVQAIVGSLAQHGTLNKIPNVAKHLGEILSSGDYRHMEDPRVQGSLRKAGHTGYYALEKTGKKLHPLPPAYVARKAMG